MTAVRPMLFASLTLLAWTAHSADLTVRVLDKQGQPLADAVVLVDSAVPGASPPPTPTMEATVRQEKMRFRPYVSVVHTGARVTFTNLDTWDHHVILGPVGPGGFDLDASQNQQMRLAGKVGDTVARDSRVVTKPGAYLLGCHLHSSMRGHLYVTDSAWSKVSEADGQALLNGLPTGPARVKVWHPDQVLETAPVNVEVSTGGSSVTINTAILTVKRR